MKEQLILALQDLQLEKEGKATLDDVTQEWLDGEITEYECILTGDASISGKKVTMKKNGIIGKFLIDANLNIIEIDENESSIEFDYQIKSKNEDILEILIRVSDKESGLSEIICPNNVIQCNGTKEIKSIYYSVKLGVEYKFKIISESGEEKEETILINDYYYNITKNLGEGISIDNNAVKAAYNKNYQATITVKEGYVIETLEVKMDGQPITVDKTTGLINIEQVTGDIEITAAAKKVEIQITEPIIATTTTETTSVDDNSQIKGTILYINFSASLEGEKCAIVNKDDGKAVPYLVTTNGKYVFVVTGTYNDNSITKEIEVTVNKYQAASNIVKYDAGDWTQAEIQTLTNKKLYKINSGHLANYKFYLTYAAGLNFTFGGFTYKGSSDAKTEGVITSRNQSVSPQSGYGTPQYDGWQILESEERDGKTYVTKIMHAGTPENFVYYYSTSYDAYRAEYLLSNGTRRLTYKTLSDGTTINPRNWDMYKDQNQLDLIDEVHCMTYDEGLKSGQALVSYFWLATAYNGNALYHGHANAIISDAYPKYCFGVRPVVTLKSGVYIASGNGTESDPYVLAKE